MTDVDRKTELLLSTLSAWVDAERSRNAMRDRLHQAASLIAAASRYIAHLKGYINEPGTAAAYEAAMLEWTHAQSRGAQANLPGNDPPPGGSTP